MQNHDYNDVCISNGCGSRFGENGPSDTFQSLVHEAFPLGLLDRVFYKREGRCPLCIARFRALPFAGFSHHSAKAIWKNALCAVWRKAFAVTRL